ncbi:MAG: transketolase-like TK C-terminal-containing protein, partial [Dehalococcoidia bacterium]
VLLRVAIDEMPNEEYQRLLRAPAADMRQTLIAGSADRTGMRDLLDRWSDAELPSLFGNLAGHDLRSLRAAFAEADGVRDQPTVIFAYTIKGWGLPFAGDPLNHSAYLTDEQMELLRASLGVTAGEEFDRFPAGSPEGRICESVAERLRSTTGSVRATPAELPAVPLTLGRPYRGYVSTQDVLGRILTDLAREEPELARRIVTASPDVATSTNLAGWINRAGVFSVDDRPDYFGGKTTPILRWKETRKGQHIELGISENNLFLLLGQLGLEREVSGQILLPIGTLYDPFVCRGLDAFIYSVYSGARFIVAGTPSGITLSPEGGAHQSVITPSIGVELPNVTYYEPCFAQELEWIVLSALSSLAAPTSGGSYYLRLTTRPLDQALFPTPQSPAAQAVRRRQVVDGGYRLRESRTRPDYRPGENVVNLFASGAVVPEALAAADALLDEGIYANLINVTSADLLYRRQQQALWAAINAGRGGAAAAFEELVSLDERRAPVVTVLDGHPHTLARLGGALGCRCLPLGVTEFGQSGTRADLYNEFRLSPEAILDACLIALES